MWVRRRSEIAEEKEWPEIIWEKASSICERIEEFVSVGVLL
jgi:hypothetical protein